MPLDHDDAWIPEDRPALREAHAPGLAFAVTGLLGGTNDWDAHHGGAPLRLLSADGLRELERAGVAIGAHTRTHPRLDRSSAGQVEDEVVGSLDDLEAAGFDRPVFLAYPYGRYDAEAKRIAAEAGLEGAFVTRPGLVEPSADRFELPRIEIMRRDTGLRFVLKVLGAHAIIDDLDTLRWDTSMLDQAGSRLRDGDGTGGSYVAEQDISRAHHDGMGRLDNSANP